MSDSDDMDSGHRLAETPSASKVADQASKKRKLSPTYSKSDLEKEPAWFVAGYRSYLGVVEKVKHEETYTGKEMLNHIWHVLEVARQHGEPDLQVRKMRKEQLQQHEEVLDAIYEMKKSLNVKKSYVEALKNGEDFDPTVPPKLNADRARHIFSVRFHFKDDKRMNFEETMDYLNKVLNPTRNQMRVSFRLSKAGNCVLEFPTEREKENAKEKEQLVVDSWLEAFLAPTTQPKLLFSSSHRTDIDECGENIHNCAPNELCFNIYRGYRCLPKPVAGSSGGGDEQPIPCGVGFWYNSTSRTCEDVNECTARIVPPCSPDAVCLNTVGSFQCHGSQRRRSTTRTPQLPTPLPWGAPTTTTGPTPRLRTPCPAGYHWSDQYFDCIDVDECEERLHNCRHDETCQNMPGSFFCQRSCSFGFRLEESSGLCQDVDECAEGSHVCRSGVETCVNVAGSYKCEFGGGSASSSGVSQRRIPLMGDTCTTGLRLSADGTFCEDIDECLSSPCKRNQYCTNTLGSYLCTCRTQGFALDPATGLCQDINECAYDHLNTCSMDSQRCDNTIGSFICVRIANCGTGYTLNHHTGICEDINECEARQDNCRSLGPQYRCKNIADIDECKSNPCQSTEVCINSMGSFRCESQRTGACSQGYQTAADGKSCQDIDECALGTHNCQSIQSCINRPGG
ncbi:unnamed protein product [Cyprideis torosa]|uniref:Uncharacterized protein n=1 Tax=Cyprideis torosa TaxID=163714 RepID=A0A7R8ZSR3_9CRUS|nr:unnamed protein product [Cyprideis torosa]CAG0896133.1 unnamed protein product [Cyprideis torosa]